MVHYYKSSRYLHLRLYTRARTHTHTHARTHTHTHVCMYVCIYNIIMWKMNTYIDIGCRWLDPQSCRRYWNNIIGELQSHNK